jgi:hypothetical protein
MEYLSDLCVVFNAACARVSTVLIPNLEQYRRVPAQEQDAAAAADDDDA